MVDQADYNDDDAIIDEGGKLLGEVFSGSVLEMNKIDLLIGSNTMAEWAMEERPVDPDVCRFFGMLLLSIAEKVENKE
ncbi:hypothetical protein [Psychrobacter sp. AOP31-A1-22]|uniref:hypothetical protein n=1 Tax=Psychrobacter sp. AOP31-A1-22 TaxID=3457696 RepID=UPI00403581F0